MTPEEILKAAQEVQQPGRKNDRLTAHIQAIKTLHEKDWSYARIAKFLTDRGCLCSASGIQQAIKRFSTTAA